MATLLQEWGPAQQHSPFLESCCGSGSPDLPQLWVFSPTLASSRATRNTWVRETVALELSYVNSNLQLLKEELAELSSSIDVDQPEGCETPDWAHAYKCRGHTWVVGASG